MIYYSCILDAEEFSYKRLHDTTVVNSLRLLYSELFCANDLRHLHFV